MRVGITTITATMIVATLISIIFIPMYRNTLSVNQEIIVNSKERVQVVTGSGSSISTSYEFFVYTENEVFSLKDSISFMHFSTYDVYNSLKENNICKVDIAGWRIPFISMTRNIIKVYNCKVKGDKE